MMNLRERWIQAMMKVPLSLIGYKGYTKEDALIVCRGLRKTASNHPGLARVLALENEVKDLVLVVTLDELFTETDSVTNLEVVTNPIKAKRQRSREPKLSERPNPDDYLYPWCRVTKDGKFVRYEDANCKPIPEVLWPGGA